MKLSQKVQVDTPINLTASPGPSGTLMSFKTPGNNLEDKYSLDMVPEYRSS